MTLRQLPAAAATLVLYLQLLVAVAVADSGAPIGRFPNCTTTCGNVSVPYPFGIEPGCYLLGFNATCNKICKRPQLFVGYLGQPVTGISLHRSLIRLWKPFPVSAPNMKLHHGIYFPKNQLTLEWKVLSIVLQRFNGSSAGDKTCPKDLGGTSCHSRHSTCTASTTGYTCKCNRGYEGNAYLSNGCQDIDECRIAKICFGNCTNLPGTYTCQCPKGTTGDAHSPNGCKKSSDSNPGLIIGLGVGSGGVLLFLAIGTTLVIRGINIRRMKNLRQKFFNQNRGQLLQQLVCHRADIAERMIVNLEELEKATNKFDKARELGVGEHGTVYKGILSSLHVVAIKKSKIVVQKEIDDFINEVAILSQINHKNIVKLLGCCLETEVPLLIYEFISNGTLYNHLHTEALVSLSWKNRMRIAVETARALAYLHSLVSVQIVHRDVKSANILLDDNLTVKLSDFGASRYVPIDQSGLDTSVQGTCGYLDPMYHSTGHLTEKSDVFSFGVVLIELVTRRKPVSYRCPRGHGLVYHFVTLVSEGNIAQVLDPQVVKEGGGEVIDVALLAAICVKFISTDRPIMREIVIALECIYAAMEDNSSDITNDEDDYDYVQEEDPSIEAANLGVKY